MKKITLAAALSLAAFISAAPAVAADAKPVELTASDLAAVQTRSYPAGFAAVFQGTIATLQTLGYLNINASKDAGTVTAQTEAKGKLIYNIFWGFGKKKRTQLASLMIEQTSPEQSVVKLNLSINEAKSRGVFGATFNDGQLVKYGEPYKEFYAALDSEMARRIAAAPAAAPAAPAASAATPQQ